MTEPLITVEGNLRLPTLLALTDPSLNFGSEWSPARSRPLRSQSEFALFAARLETAYVAALSLSDRTSPYRAVSLWGVFVKEEIPRSMLHLMQGVKMPGEADGMRADPVHLSVSAPAAPGARKLFFSKPVATAIAVASAAVIVWLLFGYEPGKRDDAPSAATREAARESAQGSTQEVTQESAREPAHEAVTQAPPDACVQPAQIAPTPEPKVAANADATQLERTSTPAATNEIAGVSTPSVEPAPAPVQDSRTSAVASMDTGASITATPAAPEPISILPAARSDLAKSPKTASATARDKVTVNAKTHSRTGAAKHATHAQTARGATPTRPPAGTGAVTHTPETTRRVHVKLERGSSAQSTSYPTQTVARQAARTGDSRNPRVKSAEHGTHPIPNPAASMSPEALYNMLQHSPTLDSNAQQDRS